MERAHFRLTKKDFELTWFSGTGGGGQHRNKHQNCARLKHTETGIICTGQSNRDRPSNLKEAMLGLKNNHRFKHWCELKLREIETGMTIEERVEKELQNNVKVQIRKDGKWVEEKQN